MLEHVVQQNNINIARTLNFHGQDDHVNMRFLETRVSGITIVLGRRTRM